MKSTLRPIPCRLLASSQLDRLQHAREIYLNLSDDDLVHGFRSEAGLLAPGKSMGGWCSGNSSVIFGQVISGLAHLGAATSDAAATAKAIRLFELWRETCGAGGDARMGTYGWDKMVGAMVDLSELGGYREGVDFLKETTEWAARTFDRSRSPASALDWDGRHPHGTLEWYTLGENLYRAARHTKNNLFKDFADVWQYPDFWNLFAATNRPQSAHAVHAYSHVNSLCSLAAAYESTGNPEQLTTLINASDYVRSTQCYATGGFGPWERLVHPQEGQLGRALELCCDHAEVGCGSWAIYKLATYLIRFTGDPRWGDWIERVLYNLIGAALPVCSDGRTTYYHDYRPSGGMKAYYESAWPCCSGTYLQAVTAPHNLIYFADPSDGALYVVLFVPSAVVHTIGNQRVTVTQETTFPVSELVTFRIGCQAPVEFALKIRVPGWCDGIAARLADGFTVNASAGTWLSINRLWSDGDTVQLHLPTRFDLEPVDSSHPRTAAIVRGPLVYAQIGRYFRPLNFHSVADLRRRVKPDAEKRPLWFAFDDDIKTDLGSGYIRPLYDFPEAAPYRLYQHLHTPFIY